MFVCLFVCLFVYLFIYLFNKAQHNFYIIIIIIIIIVVVVVVVVVVILLFVCFVVTYEVLLPLTIRITRKASIFFYQKSNAVGSHRITCLMLCLR